MELRIEGGTPLVGDIEVPPDKSITHRALMLSALCEGDSYVEAQGIGEDNQSTARVLAGLGVSLHQQDGGWAITSRGPRHFKEPTHPLDCGNSGTTMRLLSGILAGAGLRAELVGDASLSRRPMGRVCEPLRQLGGDIVGGREGSRELPPLRIGAGHFHGGLVDLAVASAQVKSSIILAGVASGCAVTVREPSASRDHTETMLKALGANITTHYELSGSVLVELGAGAMLKPAHWQIPGDFSSAAFFLAAGVLVPGSRVTVRNVGLNTTRKGLLDVLMSFGSPIAIYERRESNGEPVATLTAEPGPLRVPQSEEASYVIGGAMIPVLIDELVVLAAVASQVHGTTQVQDATELRVKESDRVSETVRLLAAFGVRAEERPDGYVVHGPQQLQAARVDVSADHRLALTAAVLALAARGQSVLTGFEVAAVSYPQFVQALQGLGARVQLA